MAYEDFHAENPSGEIGQEKFLEISKVIFQTPHFESFLGRKSFKKTGQSGENAHFAGFYYFSPGRQNMAA